MFKKFTHWVGEHPLEFALGCTTIVVVAQCALIAKMNKDNKILYKFATDVKSALEDGLELAIDGGEFMAYLPEELGSQEMQAS